jgi:hypothetical protein
MRRFFLKLFYRLVGLRAFRVKWQDGSYSGIGTYGWCEELLEIYYDEGEIVFDTDRPKCKACKRGVCPAPSGSTKG